VVIVFAAWNTISEKEIAEYMQEIADQRAVAVDTLKDFSAAISGSFKNKTPEQARVWADKQAYLALGFSLVAAAAEEIDATPMEGFAPDAVDEILGLKALGLHSAVALTLGFRDAANDYLVNAKKVRRATDKLVIKK
jgi:nitroreductase